MYVRYTKLLAEHPYVELQGQVLRRGDDGTLYLSGYVRGCQYNVDPGCPTPVEPHNLAILDPETATLRQMGGIVYRGRHYFLKTTSGSNAFGASVPVYVYGNTSELRTAQSEVQRLAVLAEKAGVDPETGTREAKIAKDKARAETARAGLREQRAEVSRQLESDKAHLKRVAEYEANIERGNPSLGDHGICTGYPNLSQFQKTDCESLRRKFASERQAAEQSLRGHEARLEAIDSELTGRPLSEVQAAGRERKRGEAVATAVAELAKAEAAKRQAEDDLRKQKVELDEKQTLDEKRRKIESATAELRQQKVVRRQEAKQAEIAAAQHVSLTGVLVNCYAPDARAGLKADTSWVLDLKVGRYNSYRPEANTRRVLYRLEDDVALTGIADQTALCNASLDVVVAVDAWSCGVAMEFSGQAKEVLPCVAKLDVIGKSTCRDEYPCPARQ